MKYKEHRCKVCGETDESKFYGNHKNYCGKCECNIQKNKRKEKSKSWKMKKQCLVCGKLFIPYLKRSKYCSHKCQSKRYKLLEPIKRRAWTLSSCIIGLKNKKLVVENLLKNSIGKKCEYCNSIITIDSASLDHKIPYRWKSASKQKKILLNQKENLHIICKKCNGIKADISDIQFKKLLEFLETDLDLKKLILKKLASNYAVFKK